MEMEIVIFSISTTEWLFIILNKLSLKVICVGCESHHDTSETEQLQYTDESCLPATDCTQLCQPAGSLPEPTVAFPQQTDRQFKMATSHMSRNQNLSFYKV